MKICCYNDGAPGLIEGGSIYPLNDALAEAGVVRARASMAEVIDALANQSAAAAAVARARQGKPVAAASARLLAPMVAGALLTRAEDGKLVGFPLVGLVAAGTALISLVLAGFIRPAAGDAAPRVEAKPAVTAVEAEPKPAAV